MRSGAERQDGLDAAMLAAVWDVIEREVGWERPPGAGASEAAQALIEAVRPQGDELWSRTCTRALRLALAVGEAAHRVDPGRASEAAMRAARAIGVASGEAEVCQALHNLVDDLVAGGAERVHWSAHVARRAAEYIRQNYRRPLTLNEVASHVGLSPAHFCAVFKRVWGIGFRRFLREVRLAEAKRLLEDPSCTIERAANGVGYDDMHYFARVFARAVGMPPGEYRRRRQAARAHRAEPPA